MMLAKSKELEQAWSMNASLLDYVYIFLKTGKKMTWKVNANTKLGITAMAYLHWERSVIIHDDYEY